MIEYCIINNGVSYAFVERYHSQLSSFHLLRGYMSITLDDVSCLLHIPIRGRLLDHDKITRDETVVMMMTYLRAGLGDSLKGVEDTCGCHARFRFMERLYA